MDAKNQRAQRNTCSSGITRFAWPCVGRLGVLVVRRLELVHIVMHLCTAREKITHSLIDGLVQILKKNAEISTHKCKGICVSQHAGSAERVLTTKWLRVVTVLGIIRLFQVFRQLLVILKLILSFRWKVQAVCTNLPCGAFGSLPAVCLAPFLLNVVLELPGIVLVLPGSGNASLTRAISKDVEPPSQMRSRRSVGNDVLDVRPWQCYKFPFPETVNRVEHKGMKTE